MKVWVALLVIAAMTAVTVAYPLLPAKNQVVTTTKAPTTTVGLEQNIIDVPEFPCPYGQRRDSRGKCRQILW